MPSCNLVFGRTGCGKTSLKNMICGGEPEPDSLTSGTTEAQVYPVDFAGESYLYVDTAGILDNRGDGEDLKHDRADKVNRIGALLKKEGLEVCRVFYCVSSTERLLQEEIDWLADIMQMLGGKEVLQVFAIVLTKVDDGFQKKKYEKDFDKHELVRVLKNSFPNCPVVTSGYDNVESVIKLMVPAAVAPAFVVPPEAIKTITPKADLETQLAHTQAMLADVIRAINNKGSSTEDVKKSIENLENEIEDLTERIGNAGWWCPGEEITRATRRIRECKNLIRDLKSNEMKSKDDMERFERKKLELTLAIEAAHRDLEEKKSLGSMFMRLLLG